MTIHDLKIREKHAIALFTGEKRCEVRKNDRDYRVGDILSLAIEVEGNDRPVDYLVTHILAHEDFPEGIAPGYVVLSVEKTDRRLEMKPCPFCGGAAKIRPSWNLGSGLIAKA